MHEKTSPLVYTLVILFGSSTWLVVTGVWVQLQLMVSIYPLPEGWSLPSYLTVIVQVAVLGPILHWLLKKYFPDSKISDEKLQIYFCMGFATLSTLFLAIFWRHRIHLFGQERSVLLFVFVFCVSLVSCTSSVLYLPSMFRFKSTYVTAYFIGMGFSALIPSLLALIQGSGRSICVVVNDTSSSLNASVTYYQKAVDPHFGVTLFFIFMFLWMLICTIAFALLNVRSIVDGQLNEQNKESSQEKQVIQDEENSIVSQQDDPVYKTESISERESIRPHKNFEDNSKNGENGISNQFWVLMLVTFWCCALMNGILPSVQSYSALPYGSTVYYLSSVLSNLSNPVGCFALFFFTIKRVNVVAVITMIITILSIYLLILASKSPQPVFGRTNFGSFLCFSDKVYRTYSLQVTSWVICMALLAYLRAVCGSLLRESGTEKNLWWCGVFTQAGSFIGSLIMFPLINVYNLFESAPACPHD